LGEVVFEMALHMRVFRSAEYSELMDDLRRHSTACANLCRVLAARTGQDPENAFVCGLLHDIGAAAILIVLGERRRSEPALEGAVLGEVIRQTHEDVSGMLVQLWKLPGDVAEVVAHHHGQEAIKEAPLLSSIVAVADSLSAKFGFSVDFGAGVADGSDQETIALACSKLKLDADAMTGLEEEAREVLDRVEKTLKHVEHDEKAEKAERPHAEKARASIAVPTDPAASVKASAASVSSARKASAGWLARIWQALAGGRRPKR
jgi:putative nucleotidyltransferase with HDIG domain